MDITKIISISLCSLIIIILLRKFNNDYAFFASSFLNISICAFSLGILAPVFEYIKSLGSTGINSNFCTVIFKCAGVCLICSLAAELCRDCGESAIASRIEFAGKCTLLAFCLPLIKQVFEYATTFID